MADSITKAGNNYNVGYFILAVATLIVRIYFQQ